jgi:hypothetical protein
MLTAAEALRVTPGKLYQLSTLAPKKDTHGR